MSTPDDLGVDKITDRLLNELKYREGNIDDKDLIDDARKQIRGLVRALNSRKQVVLHGPPGVGKTQFMVWLAGAVAGDSGRVKLVQFHESYSYDHFVEGILPRVNNETNQAGFESKEGPFLKWYLEAQKPENRGSNYVIAIDEMNRANLQNVLGELFMALERKKEYAPELVYSQEKIDLHSVPNLYIIGCMNDADRALGDSIALRRRFHYFECPAYGFHSGTDPDIQLMERHGLLLLAKGMLQRTWPKPFQKSASMLEEAIGKINRKLADEDMHGESLAHHLAVGPSYFIKNADIIKDYKDDYLHGNATYNNVQDVINDIKGVWYNSVYPYLLATFHGERTNPDKLTGMFFKDIKENLTKQLELEKDEVVATVAQEEQAPEDAGGDVEPEEGVVAGGGDAMQGEDESLENRDAGADNGAQGQGGGSDDYAEGRTEAKRALEDESLEKNDEKRQRLSDESDVMTHENHGNVHPSSQVGNAATGDGGNDGGNVVGDGSGQEGGACLNPDDTQADYREFTEWLKDKSNVVNHVSVPSITKVSTGGKKSLPKLIGQLTSLKSLDLPGHKLTTLLPTFGNLKKLERLNLVGPNRRKKKNNKLSLPLTMFDNLTNLTWLNLSHNQLANVPSTIKNLKRLQRLDLSNNELTKLPDEIGELTSLKWLNLFYNELENLPSTFGNLTNLKWLNLSGNKEVFSHDENTLPRTFRKLTNLEWLDLSCTNVNRLPMIEELNGSLRFLFLASNKLTGVPMEIKKLTELKELDLCDNPLADEFQDVLKHLKKLKALCLTTNKDAKRYFKLQQVYRVLWQHLLLWTSQDGFTWNKKSDENPDAHIKKELDLQNLSAHVKDDSVIELNADDDDDDDDDDGDDNYFIDYDIGESEAHDEEDGPPGGFTRCFANYTKKCAEKCGHKNLGHLYVKERRRANEMNSKYVDRHYVRWNLGPGLLSWKHRHQLNQNNGIFLEFEEGYDDEGKGDKTSLQSHRSWRLLKRYLACSPKFDSQELMTMVISNVPSMTKPKLEAKLRDSGLPADGNKQKLIERLTTVINNRRNIAETN